MLTATVTRFIATAEERELSLARLDMTFADAATPGRLYIRMVPKDDQGRYMQDARPLEVEIVDQPDSEDPQLQRLASTLLEILLDAVTTGPLAEAMGVAGLPIRDAGAAILTGLGLVPVPPAPAAPAGEQTP